MTVMVKRWYRSRRNQFIISIIIIFCIIYYISLNDSLQREPNLDITRRYIEKRLQEALKEDKGSGCEIPHLDPFAKEVTQFDRDLPKVTCKGQNWVRCYLSECRVVDEILATTNEIVCTYNDIIYESDKKYYLGPPTKVTGANPYILNKSDHVKIKCTGTHGNSLLMSKWIGYSLGFRKSVKRKPPPLDRKDTLNVLIFGFDSTAKNGFIRRMPKSYYHLTKVVQGTILNGYNIVGDGTPAALFPILTGKNELELPDVRKKMKNNGTLDSMPFIFYKLKEDGYRTAYFEDMPWIGTFQYRFNGFRHQPADHYLRAFYLEESNDRKNRGEYCIGDTPQYELMMNITEQFFQLDGKRFGFTFIADITHNNFNMISTADEAMVEFLESMDKRGVFQDTLLIIMGDHGPRYCLTIVDRATRWPEAYPLQDITAETCAAVLITGWISRFGCPEDITTDRGRQFESRTFKNLAALIGATHHLTTSYHPAANGLVERLHRQLKAAIMCHANSSWTEALPWVLLGIRSAWKEDLGATTAELVYGEPLRLPGQFLTEASKDVVDMSDLVSRLRAHMTKLTPQPTSWHTSSSRPFYIPKDLNTATHVFLREGQVRRSLQAPYTGPHKVLARDQKTVDIEVHGKRQKVTIDRVKPAYTAREDLDPGQSQTQTPDPVQSDNTVRKTKSGRTVRFPDYYRP